MKPSEMLRIAAASVLTVCTLTSGTPPRLLPASGAESVLTGDVNLDSAVNIADAVMLARYCAEDPDCGITRQALEYCDINNDNLITIEDCTALLRIIIKAAAPPDSRPETTETAVTATTSAAASTTTTAAETTAAAKTTYVVMKADGQVFPFDLPLSTFTDRTAPTELLTQKYQNGDIRFAVYADDPDDLLIVIADDDGIVGYYMIGTQFTAPYILNTEISAADDFTVTDYVDRHPEGTNKTYAQLVLRKGCRINFSAAADKKDLSVLSKLNFYAANGVRAINGIAPLQWSDVAAKSALSHSVEMATLNYFDHASYDGTKFSVRMRNQGVNWLSCSENIDCGYNDPFTALDGWYNSTSGHRENLLNAKFTHLGVGFAYGENSRYLYYGTQDFFLPR